MNEKTVIDYHTDRGHKPCLLVKMGTKYIHIVVNEDTGLKLKKLPKSELKYMKDIEYPWGKAWNKYRHMAQLQGLKTLSKELRQALGWRR